MATADDYANWIVKNADKKGTPDFETVSKAYRDLRSKGSAARTDTAAWEDKIKADLTGSMGGLQKFAAGYGKAIPDMAMGIGQRLGLVDQSTVDERKRLDAPLMKTGAGIAGNIMGNVAPALPAIAIPGANTIAGSAALGAGIGAIQPTGDDESVIGNTLKGAAFGGGSVAAGRLLGASYRGLKAIAEPFTAAGPQRIAGRTIERFAENPVSIAGVTNKPTITGARPTLAEQTGDRGLARLQDALRSVDPQIENALGTRAATNNAARVNALRSMTGEDGGRAFAVAERQGTAGPMYDDAFKVSPGKLGLTSEQTGVLRGLLKSEDVKNAMSQAQRIAANKGTNVGTSNADGSIEGMHLMKTALDDAISAAKTSGNTNLSSSIKDAQKRLVGLIEDISPEYKTARTVYANMSKPINQMDIAAEIAKKGLSNGSDLLGNPTINRNALLGTMKDEAALIKRATGRTGVGNALSDVMEPQQLNQLRAIASEADRAGAVATAGNGPGAATAQRLASQNILRQVIAPSTPGANPSLGQKIGQAVVENTLANTVVGKATNWIYSGIAEPKIQQALLKATLQPEEAKAALAAARQQGLTLPDNLLTRLMGQARRVTGFSASQSTRQP